MKKLVLVIALLTSTLLWGETNTPIVPNGDFENWNINSYVFPENYLFNSNAFKAMTNTPYNVIQTSDSYHGESAVKLVTDTTTNSINFGFIIGSNGENGDPTTWKGGIPITQTITGIRGYYKYDFIQPDSALIIVTFRYHGTFLAEYDFFLKEKKAAYTLFDFDIIPNWAVGINPDSVIVGFASSGNVGEGSGQPGSTLYIDSISLKGVTTQPEALNGDFERWTQHITPTLNEWNISGSDMASDGRTSDKLEGNYAVKLTTYLGNNENDQMTENPSVLYLGDYDKASNNWYGGMHLYNTLDTLSFWYKYLPSQPKDNASLLLLYIDSNNKVISNNFIPIPASAQYQEMRVPMQTPNIPNYKPCDLVMMFQSSQIVDNSMTHIGSTLYLDHLTFLPYKGLPDTIHASANPVLMNESFEIWDNSPFETPEFYPFTSNQFRMDGAFPFNVRKSTWAQHGSYSLQLITDSLKNNTNFGFVINQNPTSESPDNWTGGIPISERPTGIQGYYLYHSIGPDSAMIMVFFRKGGNSIGSYYLNLQPAMGDWTYFNKPFTPALTETPDSMILCISSGSSLGDANPVASMLMIDNISFTGITVQPEKLNGDFENWATTFMERAPGWILSDNNQPGAHKTTHAAVGSYAMELKTTVYTDNQNQTVAGVEWLSNGYWDSNIQNWAGGTTLHTQNDTLAFFYEYQPAVPDDTAQVSIMFKYQGQFLANKVAYLLPSMAYQYKEVPMMEELGLPLLFPSDSVLLIFQTSLWNHRDPRFGGSTLRLDDIHFKSSRSAVGVKTAVSSPQPEINPNPSQGISRIRFASELPERLEVYNLSGQKILSLAKERILEETILDLTGQAAGLYIVRITGEKRLSYLKLLLK